MSRTRIEEYIVGAADPLSQAEVGAAPESASKRTEALQKALSQTRPLPKWARLARLVVLASSDLIALVLAALIAVAAWAMPVRGQTPALYLELFPLLGLFPLAFAKAGLYPGFGVGAVETLRRLVLWTGFVFLILAAVSFALKAPPVYSRVTFVLAFCLSLVFLPIFRMLALKCAYRSSWWAEPVVVLGTGRRARRTIRALQGALSLGYRPQWVLAPGPSSTVTEVEGVPVVGRLDDAELLGRWGVRVVLIATEGLGEGGELVDRLQPHFRHVILIRHSRGAQIEGVVTRNMGAVLGLEFPNRLLLRRNRFFKRCLDLLIAAPALLVALPVMAVAAVLIKLVSPGPVLFRQEREGLGGEPIEIVKLRTMVVDAEARLREHLASSPEASREWKSKFKLRRDPRLIPVLGPLFRRFSIDELPQLWSVLKGEMSLVGPRPFPEYHLEGFSPRFRDLRRRVRPGVTGLWQVMVRSAGSTREQEIFDGYYIRNWSVWMDLYILARTSLKVLTGSGAH